MPKKVTKKKVKKTALRKTAAKSVKKAALRQAGAADRHQRDAQRRGNPAGWGDSAGAEVSRQTAA